MERSSRAYERSQGTRRAPLYRSVGSAMGDAKVGYQSWRLRFERTFSCQFLFFAAACRREKLACLGDDLSRPRTIFQAFRARQKLAARQEKPAAALKTWIVSAASVRVPSSVSQGLRRLETALPVCLESALGGTGEASAFDSRRLAYTRFFLRRKLAVGAVRHRFAGERHPVERCLWTASWRTRSFPSAGVAVSRPGPSDAART